MCTGLGLSRAKTRDKCKRPGSVSGLDLVDNLDPDQCRKTWVHQFWTRVKWVKTGVCQYLGPGSMYEDLGPSITGTWVNVEIPGSIDNLDLGLCIKI